MTVLDAEDEGREGSVTPEPTFSVVVLHFERGAEFRARLDALSALGPEEVVVVDNSTKDNDVRSWCDDLGFTYVQPGVNVGYGAGMNCGFGALARHSTYVLFLTHEVVIDHTAVQAMIRTAVEHRAAAVGPVLRLPNGRTWSAGGGVGHWGRVFHNERASADSRVAWLDGAAILVDRDRFTAVDGFDTDFFLYSEDVDLGLRLERVGGCWISCRANAEQATGLTPVRYRERNLVLLWRKHARPMFVAAALTRAALRDSKRLVTFRPPHQSHVAAAFAGVWRVRTDRRATMRLAPPKTVEFVNPLPRALRHYETALQSDLAACGVEVVRRADCSIERVGSRRGGRVSTGMAILRERGARRVEGEPLVVLWPAFGMLDPLTWWRTGRHRSVFVVMHDPRPLDAGFGSGSLPRAVACLATFRSDVKVIVHSDEALADLPRMLKGFAVRLPHPFRREDVGAQVDHGAAGSRERVLRVLGMAKPSRDLEALSEIAKSLPSVRKEIVGEGWSAVPGWTLDDRFLSEDEFDDAIRSSSCVIVPYSRFYQSGVVVRALEHGVPFVAPLQSQTALLAPGYEGLVGPHRSWAEAATAALEVTSEAMLEMSISAQRDAIARWQSIAILSGVAVS